MKAKHFCNWPSCNQLTAERYCPAHQLKAKEERRENDRRYNQQRGTAKERGYTPQWEKVRKIKLQLTPLCERCESMGKIVPATMVHHKIAIAAGGAPLDLENLVSCCNPCHEFYETPGRWGRGNKG